MFTNKGAILVLSGPSGAGKSSLINKISNNIGDFYFSISTTTRAMREGEEDGVHYHFVTQDNFKKDIKDGHFLEYALVHGNYYGTSLKPVKKALEENKLVIFDIDVQGNEAIQKKMSDITTSVFITPPTLLELKNRLQKRMTDSQEVIDNRIDMAKTEIKRISEYDYIIINDDLDEAAKKLECVAKSAREKISNSDINNFIKKWEDL
jgi:guanylate kinase